MPAGGPLASYTIRARFLGALAAVALTAGLGACSSRTGDHTFAPMPETCDELTETIREELLGNGELRAPEGAVETTMATRTLRCQVAGDHRDLPARVRSLDVSVTQVAQGVEAVDDTPTEQWLRQQVTATFDRLTERTEACVPTDVSIDGAASAQRCAYVEHDVYVTTVVAATSVDGPIVLWADVVAHAQGSDVSLAELEKAAIELGEEAIAVMVGRVNDA
jgi:hypothetical protein